MLTLSAEATIKAIAKDKICDFYFPKRRISIGSLMSFIVTTLAINHLPTATAAIFETLLQS